MDDGYEFLDLLGIEPKSESIGGDGNFHLHIRCPFHQRPDARVADAQLTDNGDTILFNCFSSKCEQNKGSLSWVSYLLIQQGFSELREFHRKLREKEKPTLDSKISKAIAKLKEGPFKRRVTVKEAVSMNIDFRGQYLEMSQEIPAKAIDWLISRGLDPELIVNQFGLRWDQFKDRLVTPIISADGNFTGLNGRYFGSNPDEPKNKLYYGTHKHVWMGEDRIQMGGAVVFAEGPSSGYALFNALHDQMDKLSVIMTTGSVRSNDRIPEILYRMEVKRIYFAPDGDQAGFNWCCNMREIFKRLAKPIFVIEPHKGEDPGSTQKDQLIKDFHATKMLLSKPKFLGFGGSKKSPKKKRRKSKTK